MQIVSSLTLVEPQSLTTTNVEATSLTATWTAPLVGGPGLKYNVDVSPRPSGDLTACQDTAHTQCQLTGLTPDTPYTIKVTACNTAGCGPPATTTITTPVQPVTPGGKCSDIFATRCTLGHDQYLNRSGGSGLPCLSLVERLYSAHRLHGVSPSRA